MRQINEDRQRRALLLSQRLKEIHAERDALLSQLNDLERQAKIVQRECSVLHNLDAPISALPDEMLSMIFEAGTLIYNEEPKRHFGTLVSHVAHHWRHIALATPQLWSKISFIGRGAISHSGIWEEKAISFLSRCKASPIDVSVVHSRGYNISQKLLELTGDHMGHCRQLSIKGANPKALERAVQYLSTKAAPLLRSVDFAAAEFANVDDGVKLLAPFFPSSAPHLRTAQLGGFQVPTWHFCNPGLRSVTSLRLTSVYIDDFDDPAYRSFRDALMALDCLNHLEFQPDRFSQIHARMPIVLPTMQYLCLDATNTPQDLGAIIHSFQAISLITLSLDGWDHAEDDAFARDALDLNFPSLDHLILLNIGRDFVGCDVHAQRFLGINRLTFQVATNTHHLNIDNIINSMCFRTEDNETGTGWERWPKLRVLAVSATDALLNPVELCSMLSGTCGLQKLMLPKCVFSHVGTNAIGKLREFVEVEDYWLDWPTPFAQCS